MMFLKPNKTKISLTGILILIIFLFSISSSTGSYLVNKSATTQFEKAAKVELENETKPLLEKLNKQSFDGIRFSSIYFRALYTNMAISIFFAVLLSYLGSCIICRFFINTRGS
jgi:uncharacterized membrane protein